MLCAGAHELSFNDTAPCGRVARSLRAIRYAARRGILRTALTTTDLSLVESFRLALETEGIAAQVSNQNTGALPFNALTVAVLHDDEYDRAVEVLSGLQRTTPPSIRSARWSRRPLRLLLLLLAAVGVVLCGSIFIW